MEKMMEEAETTQAEDPSQEVEEEAVTETGACLLYTSDAADE